MSARVAEIGAAGRAGVPVFSGALLSARAVRKTYRLGRVRVPVLHGVDLDVGAGEWVAILGASGSGKSTLLHLLGGLDRPDRGPRSGSVDGPAGSSIRYAGAELASYSAAQLNRYRSRDVGFVFQFYHLLPELTVVENVAIGAMVRLGRLGYLSERGRVLERAGELLEAFGLSHRRRHRPVELSGGERQRVAIARALINGPAVLLADEPTGNLDRKTGNQILDVLAGLRESMGLTLVMVTHDGEVAGRADRVVRLVDGRVAVEADPTAASAG
jgi:lipoprotein-releasing system ATP-binding protein